MNDYDYPGTGPCADYEFEIAEWLDGELSPERARIISLHVGTCVRCRAWRESYAAIDTRLAASLPRPALSADFAGRVAESIDSLSRLDSSAREAIEHDYLESLARLRRGWRLPAVLNGLAAAAVAFCALILLNSMGVRWPTLEFADASRVILFGSQGLAVIALVAGLAWSRAHSAGGWSASSR
jgi:anti-sigma factor RsiW